VRAAELVVRTFERERFAPVGPGHVEIERALEASSRVRALIVRR
jgi:hypothetical protein